MNPPRAAKRGRGRPERQIEPDFGPAEGLLAGRVLLGYRTDPEAPSAPAIRAARRKVIYHQLWMIGFLGDEHHEAADRYLHRLEVADGAKVGMRGSGGAGYGPTMAQVAALADLRQADAAIGGGLPDGTVWNVPLIQDVRQVIGRNLWPKHLKPEAFRDALGRMAAVWGM